MHGKAPVEEERKGEIGAVCYDLIVKHSLESIVEGGEVDLGGKLYVPYDRMPVDYCRAWRMEDQVIGKVVGKTHRGSCHDAYF